MILMFSSFSVEASMQSMDDDELSQVTAQAGVTVLVGAQVSFKADNIKFSDSDTADKNWLEFRDFSIHNGNSSYYAVKTPDDSPITIDVATDDSGRSYIDMNLTHYIEPRSYRIGNLVFCDQPLGSLDINGVSLTTNHWRLGNHTDGTTGIDWEYRMKMDIESIKYSYNDGPTGSLTMSGIHFAGNASGAPEDPDSWAFDGDFKFGDFEDKPATFDVGTNDAGEGMVLIGLPMQGSFRVEDVNFGGSSFGPCAVDGINVHRLSVAIGN